MLWCRLFSAPVLEKMLYHVCLCMIQPLHVITTIGKIAVFDIATSFMIYLMVNRRKV